MTTSDFDKHKVDHLFLLIGENPLPNYVAARLLLENGGTVHLVYTTQTKKRADLLKAELTKLNITVKPVELGDSSADGYKIRNKIKEKIKTPKVKLLLEGRIGLNYTGGTKAMAVHAYQVFVELELDDPVFSYLDSIKLEMCIDDIDNNKIIRIPSALAVCPQPKLEQILGLHNLSWKENKEPVSRSQLPNTATELAKLYKNHSDAIKHWIAWHNAVLQQGYKDPEGWRDDEYLINSNLTKLKVIKSTSSGKVVEIPEEVQKILRDTLNIEFSEEIDIQVIKDKYNIKLSHIYEWLSNGWLEDYVMYQVEQIAQKYSIQREDLKRSLHIEDPENKRDKDQFEFDVAFLRGYQLFGISCLKGGQNQLQDRLDKPHSS